MPYEARQSFGLKIKLRTVVGLDAVKASRTHGTGNSKIRFTAKVAGAAGNSITVALVNPGSTNTLSVGVVGNAITVTLGYASGAINSTVNDVIAKIYETAAAAALVDADNSDGDGTGLMTALAASALTGGADGTHTYQEIQGVGDVELPGLGRTTIDITSHSSPGAFAEYLKGKVRDGREFTMPLNFDPDDTVHQALADAEESDDPVVMQFQFDEAPSLNFESDVLVLDIPKSFAVRGKLESSVKCMFTGAPTLI